MAVSCADSPRNNRHFRFCRFFHKLLNFTTTFSYSLIKILKRSLKVDMNWLEQENSKRVLKGICTNIYLSLVSYWWLKTPIVSCYPVVKWHTVLLLQLKAVDSYLFWFISSLHWVFHYSCAQRHLWKRLLLTSQRKPWKLSVER